MLREIATEQVTKRLLETARDSRTHAAVKVKLYEVLESIAKEVGSDPSLRQVVDAFEQLKRSGVTKPEVPQKKQISEVDKLREEEELQLALALSVKDQQNTQQQKQSETSAVSGATDKTTSSGEQATTGKTAATVTRVRALYDLHSDDPGELSFRRGDVIKVVESVYADWWKGSLRGEVGIFPLNYVEPIPEPTAAEIAAEAEEERKVFEESRNIDRLLSLLTSSNGSGTSSYEEEELQRLYQSTQSIRPRLVKMIEKYGSQRDDLVDLDRRFLSARRTYDSLIESSLAALPAPPPPPPQSYYPPAPAPIPQGYSNISAFPPHNYPMPSQGYVPPPASQPIGQQPEQQQQQQYQQPQYQQQQWQPPTSEISYPPAPTHQAPPGNVYTQ